MKKTIVSFVLFGLIAAAVPVQAMKKKERGCAAIQRLNIYLRDHADYPEKHRAAWELLRFLYSDQKEQPEEIDLIVNRDPQLAVIAGMAFYRLTGKTKTSPRRGQRNRNLDRYKMIRHNRREKRMEASRNGSRDEFPFSFEEKHFTFEGDFTFETIKPDEEPSDDEKNGGNLQVSTEDCKMFRKMYENYDWGAPFENSLEKKDK